MTPPPTAVVRPRIEMPSISICFSSPNRAPDTAKAMVPTISNDKSSISDMFISYLPVVHVLDLMVFNGAAFMAAKKSASKICALSFCLKDSPSGRQLAFAVTQSGVLRPVQGGKRSSRRTGCFMGGLKNKALETHVFRALSRGLSENGPVA